MNITIVAKKLDLTPSIKKFIEDKFGSLARMMSSFEKEGGLDCFVEISRTTRHHKSGEVFYTEATMRLPGKTLRAEASDLDIRIAIDGVKDTLKAEINKYKEKTDERRKK
jgi:ribosomal subunit interface protein